MRILIIEDNRTTADYLLKGFKEHYFLPDVALNGEDGLYLAQNHSYEAIVLDVMLPNINGWQIIQKIRESDICTPIIFVTARDSVEDRVKGLELGADDYLIKPFSFIELLARIRSLLRRKELHVESVLQLADLEIDTRKNRVTRGLSTVPLSAKEYLLLLLMMQKKGEVLSRTLIAEKVWDINFDSDTNVIDVAISRLRDKIDKGYDNRLIHTVRGVGYVLAER